MQSTTQGDGAMGGEAGNHGSADGSGGGMNAEEEEERGWLIAGV